MKKYKSLSLLIKKYCPCYTVAIIYIGVVMLFIPWNMTFGGDPVYPFVMQTIFPMLGVSLIFLSLILKSIKVFVLGICVVFAFWINLLLLFLILPLLIGN